MEKEKGRRCVQEVMLQEEEGVIVIESAGATETINRFSFIISSLIHSLITFKCAHSTMNQWFNDVILNRVS